MATRKNTFLVKRSNVPNKVPTAGQLLLGELALNTADVILYASGTTANAIIPIGWDRIYRTGDTMTGSLFVPYLSGTSIYGISISAATISATTYLNLPRDVFVTGGTYASGTITFRNNTGGTFTVTGLVTGDTFTTGTTIADAKINFNRNDVLSAYSISISAITAQTPTLYTSNGSLTSNRVVNLTNNTLRFSSSTDANQLILSGGNVGIGTVNPLAKLEVSGTVRANSFFSEFQNYGFYTARKNNHLTQNAYYDGTWKSYGSTAQFGAAILFQTDGESSNALNIVVDTGITSANEALTFTGLLTLKTNGNLLLGGASDTGYKLNVNGTTYINATNPLTLVGLQSAQDETLVTVSPTGVLRTVSISGVTGKTDVFVTGGTYSNGTITFRNNTGGTFNVTGLYNSDVFVTGASYSNNTFTFRNNTGGTFNILFNTVTGLTSTGNINISGDTTSIGNVSGSNLISTFSSGDEGGEIKLSTAQNNTTLSGGSITIDIYQNKLRFFEAGSPNRGAYIDLTEAANGVGTNLLASTTDTFVTGGTYSNGILTFTNNSGNTFIVTGLLSANTFVTGGSYSNGIITFVNSTGGTFTVTGLISANTFTTGTTIADAKINFNRNDVLSAYSISISAITAQTPTLYTSDGLLTSNRIVNLTSNTLRFSSSTDANQLILSGGNIGIGVTNPLNKFDVVRGTAGAMSRGAYETASFSYNTDNKIGIYYAGSAGGGGASLMFGATNFTASANYPGFELQFNPSSSLTSNYMRFNYVGRNAAGVVAVATTDILNLFQSGSVTINRNVDSGFKFDVNGTVRFSGVTNPLRIGGLTEAQDQNLLTIDSAGVVHTVPLSGVTGRTDVFVTGGTYSNGTITFRNNTGGTFTVSNLFTGNTDVFVTGGSYSNGTITFVNNTGGTFNVTGLYNNDVFVTGGSYSNGIITLRNNTGGTSLITGLLSADTFVTGGTYNKTTGNITLTNSTGGSFNITGLTQDSISAFTYTNNQNTFTITDRSGTSYSAYFNNVSGLTVNGNINNLSSINFNLTATSATTVGQLAWDEGTGTLALGLAGGNVDLQVGQETLVRVYNLESTTLNDGELVYIAGAQGNNVAVRRASNTGETTSLDTIGMVTEPIASGSEGFVTINGTVNGLNTIGYSGGTPLWLGTTPGTYTATKPQAPYHAVLIGFVQRVNATVGSIFIHVASGWELDELHNVLITGVTNLDILQYNSVSELWENTNTPRFTSISATTYFNLPIDVFVTGGTYSNGNILYRNNTGGTFNVTGLLSADTFVTGGTYTQSSGTLTLRNNTGGTINITGFYNNDVFVTGGSYTQSTATLTLRNNTGGTFNVTGFYNNDVFVTGGTYSNGTITFRNNTGGTFNVTGLYNNDVFVTGGTYANGVITLANNTGGTSLITGLLSADTFVTGGTYTQSSGTLTLRNNTGGTFNITGFYNNDVFVTGGTYNNGVINFRNNTGGTFSVLGLLSADTFVTGGTYTQSSGTLTLRNNTGGTFNVTGFYNNDVFVTGGTYSNGVITFRNNTGGTFTVTNLFSGSTDVFVTGGTYSNGVINFRNNTGGTFSVLGLLSADTFVTGGTYANGTITFRNNTGGTFTVTGFFVSGITQLNGLSASSQTFVTGTGGTDFNISSTGTVHTFNIPDASQTARGLVNTGIQTFTGNKIFDSRVDMNSNTFIEDLTVNQTILVRSSAQLAGVGFPYATGYLTPYGTSFNTAGFTMLGANTYTWAQFSAYYTPITNITTNNNGVLVQLGENTLQTSTTGTHPLLAQLAIKPFTIGVNGGASITNTATVYVEGPGVGGTNNYSLWVDSGDVRIDNRVSIGTSAITNGLNVSAATDPVRIIGLTANSNDANVLTIDTNGVVHTVTKSSLVSSSDVFVTGGTYTNGVITFRNNTGGTFSVTGLLSADTFVTGGTYTQSTATLTLRNNTGGTFNVTGFYNNDVFVTGGTYNNGNIIFTNNTGGTFNVTGLLSADTFVTGGTYTQSTATLTLRNNTGGTINITGFYNNDVFVTGGTYTQSTATLTLRNNTGGTFNVSGFYNNDVFVTGGTYSNGVINFRNNTGGTFSVLGLLSADTFVTGGTYSQSSGTLTLRNNTGGTFNVTGFYNNDIFVTGGTYSNGNIIFTNNSGGTFNVGGLLSADTFVTGGTYTQSSGTLTLRNNTGGTFNVTGFYNNDVFVTGGTYTQSTATLTLRNNTGGTFNVTGFYNNDVFVTGGTYANGTITFRNNTGGTFNVSGLITGDTFTTGTTIADAKINFNRNDVLSAYSISIAAITAQTPTLYTSDGSLSTNRLVLLGSNTLRFSSTVEPNQLSLSNGNVGVGILTPTNELTVSATTDPVRIIGLTANSNDANVLTIDTNGVVHTVTKSSLMSSSDVFVTGGTYANGVITFRNNTGGTFTVLGLLSADTFVTGGTYSQSSGTLTLRNNTGGTFNVTGFYNNDVFVTGGTYATATGIATFTNNTGGTFTITGFNTNYNDTFVTGGTYTQSSGTLTLRNNTGGTFNVTGFYNNDVFVTGGTYASATGIATFRNNTGGTFTVTGFNTNLTDTFVTGGTYSQSNGTLTLRNNTGGTFNVTGFYNNDVFVTGGTYAQSNGTLTLRNNTGGTFNVTGFYNNDVFVTGGTYASATGIATFTNNTGGTFNVTGFNTNLSDTFVTGGTYSNGVINFRNNTGGTFSVSGLISANTFTTGTTIADAKINFNRNDVLSAYSISIATITGQTPTLYTSDGNLTSNRIVNLTSNTLRFTSSNEPNQLSLSNGSVGIGILTPTNELTVSGTTDPVRIIGLTANSNDANVITIDTNGVLHTVSKSSLGSGNDTFVTGGTYSNGVITFRNNTGGTFSVLGLLSADTFVSGGTYSNGVITFRNNTGGTFTVTGLISADTFTTGTTIADAKINFNRNDVLSAFSISIAAITGQTPTIYTSDGTLTANRTLNLGSSSLTISGNTLSRFFTNGNVSIGDITDDGNKLQVNNGNLSIDTNGQSIVISTNYYTPTSTIGRNIWIGTNAPSLSGAGGVQASYNTAMGYQSQNSLISGSSNTSYGYQSMFSNVGGSQSVGFGGLSLYSQTFGFHNTAIGHEALYYITTGTKNTSIGWFSGRISSGGTENLTTGSQNVYVGAEVRASTSAATNEVVIGYAAIGNGNNSVTIGNTSITKTILRSNVGIGTSSPGFNLDVFGSTGIRVSGVTSNKATKITDNAIYFSRESDGVFGTSISGNNAMVLATTTNFVFQNNSITTATLFQNGNLMIGNNLADSGYRLDVSGNTRIRGNADGAAYSFYVGDGTQKYNAPTAITTMSYPFTINNGPYNFELGFDNTGYNNVYRAQVSHIFSGSDATGRVIIYPGGNAETLNIDMGRGNIGSRGLATSWSLFSIMIGNSGAYGWRTIGNNDDYSAITQVNQGNTTRGIAFRSFNTTQSEAMRLSPAGNLLMNNTVDSTLYKLDVFGNVRLSAVTNPLVLVGLTANTSDANLLSIGSNGEVHTYPVSSISGGSGSGSATTIYNGDGTLSSNRLVNMSTFSLRFSSATASNNLVLSGGNVSIGTATPQGPLLLDLVSTTKGVAFPRMTEAQRTALTTVTGMIVYQTDADEGLYIYKSTGWVQII